MLWKGVNSWEHFLVTILAQLQHSRFSSVSMCMEVVFFYIFPVNKEIFTLITFIFSIFECLHLMCFLILVPSRDWNHIFHNYDTKVEKDTLINEDDAHKVFFCTFSDLLKILYMWPNHMNLEDGKHVDVKMLFSSKWSYLAVFSCSLDMFRICMFLHCFFRFKICQ